VKKKRERKREKEKGKKKHDTFSTPSNLIFQSLSFIELMIALGTNPYSTVSSPFTFAW
jgi:hypothetical protein